MVERSKPSRRRAREPPSVSLCRVLPSDSSGRKKTPRECAAFLRAKARGFYFEIERRNIRSIFSLVASQQDCEACAAASAWLAAVCAPLAVDDADCAAAFAASAALLVEARSAVRRLTCCLRLSTSACRGFRSW